MALDDSILKYVSDIDEVLQLSEFIDDEQIDEALSAIVKLQVKPDIPPQAAIPLILQLQAISSKCSIRASYLKNVISPKAGTPDYQKKNLYFTLADVLDKMVMALKYCVKV